MKKKLTALVAAACLLSGWLPTASLAAHPPMHPVLEQLDLDGDLLVYMNTSTIEQRVLDYIEHMSQMMITSFSGDAQAQALQLEAVAATIEKVKAGIEWSGLLSLESYAMSMASVDGTLNRVVSVAQHAEADAGKPLWRLLASNPKALKGIHYVPADAVYTANSTASLDEAWKIVNEFIAQFLGEPQATAFIQKTAMFEMVLGTNITAITGSLENDVLLSLQLSEDKTITIPQGQTTLTIPEPNLLIGLETKNGLLGKILPEKLKLMQMPITESTHAGVTLHTLNMPVPLPVPVQLTLATTDHYLLLGSSREAVVKALDCQASHNGLTATPLYQKLLAGAPAETSAIEFMSPRFMQTYIAIMKQAMGLKQGRDEAAMIDMMLGGYENMYAGGYSLKTPTSLFSKSYADYGGAKPVEMAASSYIGLLAAIGIPSFQKARSSSQDKVCQNNRRIIEAAKEQWAMKNNKPEGSLVAEADITEYIKGGLPMLVCPKGGTYAINPVGTDCECSAHNAANNLKENIKRPAVEERVPVARISGRQISKHPFVIDRYGFVLPHHSSQTLLPLIKGLDMDLSPGLQIEQADVETALKIIDICDGSDYLRNYIQIESLDLMYPDFIDMRLAGDIRVRMPRFFAKNKTPELGDCY